MKARDRGTPVGEMWATFFDADRILTLPGFDLVSF